MKNEFDLAVIGGGIVGISTAREAAARFPRLRIVVLEKEPSLAGHQTGHNSGVIHSGIYYRPGSLKAKNCVSGAGEMVRFCRENGIEYELCGKVIVATEESETLRLQELRERGNKNGVEGLRLLSPEQLREIEPHCRGVAALQVPSAGITDYGAVARKYAELATAMGVEFRMNAGVHGFRRTADRVVLETEVGAIEAKRVVNCAGLHSDRIMRLAGDDRGFQIIPFRGEYYKIAPERQSLVRHLIYPVPDPRFPFLGVHFTRHIGGFIEAGPNAVLALSREGYRKSDVNGKDVQEILSFPGFWRMAAKYWREGAGEVYRSLNKHAFTVALQKLVPDIREADLIPAGSGVRAQVVDRDGKLVDDFLIVPSDRVIHVCNVPSPAATSSLVIGKQIVEMAIETMALGAA